MYKKADNQIKRNTSGFLLLEFLIYISIFCIIIGACFSWIVQVYQPFMQKDNHINALASLYSAHNLFMRDIYTTPSNSNKWLKIDTHEIVWRTKKGDIGWRQQNDQLVRSFGTYDSLIKSWKTRKQSIVAAALHTVSFSVQKREHFVKSIKVHYVMLKQSIDQTIWLRNRIIE